MVPNLFQSLKMRNETEGDDNRREVTTRAIRMILQPEQFFELVKTMSTDPDPDVRATAAIALSEHSGI